MNQRPYQLRAVGGTVLLIGGAVSGCGSPTESGSEPSTILVSPSSVSLDAIGATKSLAAEVRDRQGRALPEVSVMWQSSSVAVATVSPDGVVTAVGPGLATVTAGAGDVAGTAGVSVAPVAVAIIGAGGDRQLGVPAETLPRPLVVEAVDRLGGPVPGTTVTFAPAPGSGSVDPAQDLTDPSGRASTRWTLGAVPGAHSLTASIGAGPPVVFSATAAGETGLSIELDYLDPPTATVASAFDEAVGRWAELIPGKPPAVFVQLPAGSCGATSPSINRAVDDILVFITLDSIDGERGTVGRAGVCGVRAASGLPVVSRLTLDNQDVPRLTDNGRLVDVILHELAHALGFGALWRGKGLVADPSLPDNPGSDAHFTGPAAIQAFDAIGGTGYTTGQKVPVENTGAVGMRDNHWRGSVFLSELMTAALAPGANPLSRVTVASLQDLGYQVDEARADAFQVPLGVPPLRAVEREPLLMGDDVYRDAIHVIDGEAR